MTAFTLGGLALGTEYLFGIMAFNNLGESNYTQDIVKARTSSKSRFFLSFFFHLPPFVLFLFHFYPIIYFVSLVILFLLLLSFGALLVAILSDGNRKTHPVVVVPR